MTSHPIKYVDSYHNDVYVTTSVDWVVVLALIGGMLTVAAVVYVAISLYRNRRQK
jgi:hypothetical protein